VDFDGAAAATTSVSSEGTAGTRAWMSGIICPHLPRF
jgi:hypothetical protein